MLFNKTYCGYSSDDLYEIGEEDKFEYFELKEGYTKIITEEEKEYLQLVINIFNYITEVAKYDLSYKEWLITQGGIYLDPDSIVFDHKNNKIVTDACLFRGLLLEGMVSEQVKEMKKGIIEVKRILKDTGLDTVIAVKPTVIYEDSDKTKPCINNQNNYGSNYFSKKIVACRITIDSKSINNAVKGFLTLLGTKAYLFDKVATQLSDIAYITRVK
jgi:hypothetical protein